ncbi:MAG: phosphoribosyl 1,2-cyclic phosphate phosphodiesterase [Sphingobacteriales bacterium]
MKITFLGTGTSQGVPVIACNCKVCISSDEEDKRLRTSIMIEHQGSNFVIDSGPDFRTQMLRENVQKLDAIIFTHEHKDHTAGLDDVRAFNFKSKKSIPIYAHPRVQESLKMEFGYIFADNKYPGTPQIDIHSIDKDPFFVNDIKFAPIEVLHYTLPVLGFRVEGFTYITDAKTISESEKEKIKGTKVLVLNALRRESHISHFTLEEALELIAEINPEKAYLTHISHQLGKHHELQQEIPENVFMAYDGLKVTI